MCHVSAATGTGSPTEAVGDDSWTDTASGSLSSVALEIKKRFELLEVEASTLVRLSGKLSHLGNSLAWRVEL